ncbi:MAG: PhoH family protein [Fusobacteriaceae bacterium]|nr:PhoH family protein [Fusobacteriaceae bacterium]MBN2838599.1 PhoH family protein [Fusobacteriaceae bacterium]
MKKTFILDTNVLIHDPNSIFSFKDNKVILPIYVIEEIDKLKRSEGEKGRNARVTARSIDDLRKNGSLFEGVQLDNGGFFRVEVKGDYSHFPSFLQKDSMDNRILAVVLKIIEDSSNSDEKVVLVTKDINMRIKADSLNIEVEDYETDNVSFDELYKGFTEIIISEEDYKKYVKTGKLKLEEPLQKDFFANQFFKLKFEDKEVLGIYNQDKNRIDKLSYSDIELWGIRAKNSEQSFAVELLMNPNIQVVTLVGKAGTGKTLLALASALEQTVERGSYKKILVARPIIPMGKDIGYLPGGEKEKLRPWVQPIYDNFEFLASNKGNEDRKSGEKAIFGLESMGLLKIEALTYIRGRSIPKGLIIIDEAQNLTPHEVKTIVTRAGMDTKIIFTGDPQQIDNPYLDANSNGLTYLAEKFKNEKIAGHITLEKGERSPLAELAAKLL